ncbi:MAG: hypothetical protein ACTSPW_13730, partial [Promethearchaeota archaeon]
MLYSIFIYQSTSGILMYDKNFQDISKGKMELFSSFFSAIKSFISEMILEGSKELKNIGLGDYTILITSIPEIKADLVLIVDQEDVKIVNKLIPKIIKILLKHQQLFLEWDGNRDEFSILDQPLTELILSKKKLVEGTSILEKPGELLKTMWEYKGELPEQKRENLIKERDFLIRRLEKTTNLLRKLAIAEKILKLSEELKDDNGFLHYQKEVKQLKDEIKDTKLKLDYYLKSVKENINKAVERLGEKSIKEGDFKDVYLNLYSFSTKLKNITASKKWEEYREMAQKLIDKDSTSEHELSEIVSNILKMSDNID